MSCGYQIVDSQGVPRGPVYLDKSRADEACLDRNRKLRERYSYMRGDSVRVIKVEVVE